MSNERTMLASQASASGSLTKEEVNKTIGRRMRQRRRKLELTLKQVAERVGVTYQQIQKYECGQTAISAAMLHLVAVALQMSVADFYPASAYGPASAISPLPAQDTVREDNQALAA
jgi:transcriptional regulator with XRE-family HTH domain